jgi:predicted kinase
VGISLPGWSRARSLLERGKRVIKRSSFWSAAHRSQAEQIVRMCNCKTLPPDVSQPMNELLQNGDTALAIGEDADFKVL